ncbi:MAG: family 1 glycosylhydrolase [Defluviitaleaceae bacterium]|nr:family 1 glycosylhydrolase [Defluviitaleaceae bacterium]
MNLPIKLGVASASAQIEGGNLKHNWNDWHIKGHIKDGSNPTRACDHWNRWREDIDLMADMGIRHYRFSIEWARLEPENGFYDGSAAVGYREMILYMKGKDITPLLTLHHFTNPMWFEEMGGFANPENIPVFLKFVAYAVRTFGDLVEEYITINEPNVFAVQGYYAGEFPPGQKSATTALKVMSIMACCHVRAYQLIHQMREEMGHIGTKVGFAHHMRVFTPVSSKSAWHTTCAKTMAWLFQGALTKACLTGRFSAPMRKYIEIKPGEYSDFLALNYYTRSTVTGTKYSTKANAPVNDLGWEIYPKGIVSCATKLYETLPRPIYITESGTCDNNDTFRSKYIYDHLMALVKSKLPVSRYYHWCFTDNFEWCEGESARFGLVHMDYETQERTIKDSGRFYMEMIKTGLIKPEMLDLPN